jgi:CheY-like chemotaxis protein
MMTTTPGLTDCRILVVDDEEANVDLLTALLEDDGFQHLASTRDPRQVVELYESFAPDLVLLDLHMPHLSGFAVMEQLAELRGADDFLPILVLTADVNPEARLRALRQGASDFLTKPLDAIEVTLRIRNLLATRVLHRQQQAARARAEAREAPRRVPVGGQPGARRSLDVQTTLAILPRLAVPLGVAHVDPEQEARIRRAAPEGGGRDHPLTALFRRGESLLVPRVTPAILDDLLVAGEHRRMIAQLDPRSAMVVPLAVGDRHRRARRWYAPHQAAVRPGRPAPRRGARATRGAGRGERATLPAGAGRHARARRDARGGRARPAQPAEHHHDGGRHAAGGSRGSADRSKLGIVQRSAQRMNRLIQDLLDMTRMETGRHRAGVPRGIGETLMSEAIEMLNPLAAAQGIRLEQVLAAGLPTVRPTPRGSCRSSRTWWATRSSSRRPRAHHALGRARGPRGPVLRGRHRTGDPVRAALHIFGRFWQANRTDRRGVGLGLAIAKGIVEAHDGRIWVRSREGEGATFYFTLPLVAALAPVSR